MKSYKCIELETTTKKFTVGKVYKTDDLGYITSDDGERNWWVSPITPVIFIGEEKRKGKNGVPYIEPLFAHFEPVS